MQHRMQLAAQMIRSALIGFSTEEKNEIVSAALRSTTLDQQTIEAALHNNDRNIDRAAFALGVSRRTLQNHLAKLGLPRSRGGRPKKPVE